MGNSVIAAGTSGILLAVTRCLRFLWAALLMAAPANAADYYVATTGDDDAAGTEAAPFQTVERAQMAAAAGDTVFIRGGVYEFSGTTRTVGVTFSKSGSADRRINYFAYPGELPIFDLFELTPQQRVTGFDVTASWIHIRGIEVRGVQQEIVGDSWGVRIRGNNNIVEQLDVHDGEAPGIFIAGSAANNLVLNCDSHHNYDPLEDGGNGDGFGCHSTGAGNILRGCRGYWNSDDGFDFINAPGACTVENSWAFNNGFVPETSMGAGNGAGFKAGGFGSPPTIPSTGVPRHVIRFNVAFGNRSQGFYANHHPGGLDFLNNTAFDNATNFDMLVEGGTSTHVLHNNVAMAPGTAITRFTGGMNEFNSWDLDINVSAADFQSTAEADALLPRQADGSLPAAPFARLAEGSDLIDRGTDVGFPFEGSAPDLGAFEFGAKAGGGGMSGGGMGGGGMSGGRTGTAGGGTSSGGRIANGGSVSSTGGGGAASSGGARTSGGATGAGGSVATQGGSINSGGVLSTGGATSGGRATSTGGSIAVQGGSISMTGGSSNSSESAQNDGCGCEFPARRSAGSTLAVGLIALAMFFRRHLRRN
jgi:hypothetical protein